MSGLLLFLFATLVHSASAETVEYQCYQTNIKHNPEWIEVTGAYRSLFHLSSSGHFVNQDGFLIVPYENTDGSKEYTVYTSDYLWVFESIHCRRPRPARHGEPLSFSRKYERIDDSKGVAFGRLGKIPRLDRC